VVAHLEQAAPRGRVPHADVIVAPRAREPHAGVGLVRWLPGLRTSGGGMCVCACVRVCVCVWCAACVCCACVCMCMHVCVLCVGAQTCASTRPVCVACGKGAPLTQVLVPRPAVANQTPLTAMCAAPRT